MTNVPGARGREPGERKDEAADADVFFPSEGTFSAVVPLSQVRGGRAASQGSAAAAAFAREESEETTLVPSRMSPSARERRGAETRRGGRHWLAMTAAVALSVFAGLAVGAYMVWSGQTRRAQPPVTTAVDAGAPSQAATEAPQPEPSPVAATSAPEVVAATSAPEVAAAGDAIVKVEKAETSESARKAEATAAVARASAAEPVSRRAAVRERAKADEESPAPKPARREATHRRQATPTQSRPPATAANGRALPVSSPPPSAKSRTVIQWP